MQKSSLFSLMELIPNVDSLPFWSILARISESNARWPEEINLNSKLKIIQAIKWFNCNGYDASKALIILNFYERAAMESCLDSFLSDKNFQHETKDFFNSSIQNDDMKDISKSIFTTLMQKSPEITKIIENLNVAIESPRSKLWGSMNINTQRTFAPHSSVAIFIPEILENIDQMKDVSTSPCIFSEEISPIQININEQPNLDSNSQNHEKSNEIEEICLKSVQYFDIPVAVADVGIEFINEEIFHCLQLYNEFLNNLMNQLIEQIQILQLKYTIPETSDCYYDSHIKSLKAELECIYAKLCECRNDLVQLEIAHIEKFRNLQQKLEKHWEVMAFNEISSITNIPEHDDLAIEN